MLGHMYSEWPSRIPGAMIWRRTAFDEAAHRVLPDGCMDVIHTDGRLFVAGPDTSAFLAAGNPGTVYTGLRFPPGVAPAMLGVAAHELRDRRVPLEDLWPAGRVRTLRDRVEAGGGAAAIEAIGLAPRSTPAPWIPALLRLVHRGGSVTDQAAELGLSTRQLHRRCLDVFGYGSRTLARVFRVNDAVRQARAGTPLATVAVNAGYADQAHLSREVKALAGVPMTELIT